MIQDPLGLLALLTATTALGFFLEKRLAWARKIGASLLVIGLGALLSNVGLVPASSPVYDAVWGPVTSLAIVWLLLAVRLEDLRAAGPRMLLAFGLGVVGTAAGALVAVLTLGRSFGSEAAKLGGALTGTYSGGSLNFIAVGRALELPDSLFAAATAADNLVTALWMGVTLLLPLWMGVGPEGASGSTTAEGTATARQTIWDEIRLAPAELLGLLALGFGLILAADTLAAHIWGPSVLWLTLLTLTVGLLSPARLWRGAPALGFVALNLLFVVIGIGSRIREILEVGIGILLLTLVVVAIHGVVLFVGARLLSIDMGTAAVASQAAIGGPSTAIAVASSRGWPSLALPGMAVGLLGYAVGNFAGFAVAGLLAGWIS